MDKVTVPSLQKKKKAKSPIVALTCYDAASGRLIDEAGVDVALVGDSLANTRLGYENTLPVTVEEMIHHTRAARRGVKNALLVGDLPFQSYEAAPWQAVLTAGRFVKEGGADAVKLEGGARVAEAVRAIVQSNVPVMGHIGLTPQSVLREGGYRVQGRERKEAEQIFVDALLLEKLGVFAIVLEGIPSSLARRISRKLRVPTIGIGAGEGCDGQVLVLDDVLGWTARAPRFVKKYADLATAAGKAVRAFAADVRARRFPDADHAYE